jgi:hypothetical protein
MHLVSRANIVLRFHSTLAFAAATAKPAAAKAQAEQVAPKDIPSRNYLKFQSKYDEFVKLFNEKVAETEKANRVPPKAPTGRPYTHPYNMPHNPINFSGVKSSELFHDFIGPEQVSPHYENFLVARKYLLLWFGGLLFISAAAGTTDLNWVAKSSYLPFLFWMQIMYFYLEGRKSFFKPLLARFYRRVAMNEIFQIETFYQESMELKIRDLLDAAKRQLEYGFLHKDYRDVKGELINIFLMNEQLNLQKHVTDRTLSVLQQAVNFEKKNQQRLLNDIVEAALRSLEENLKNETTRQAIEQQMFESALVGLSKGQMEYQNDPLLPLILSTIKREVEKVQGLTAEQQVKLISLTKEQIDSIR